MLQVTPPNTFAVPTGPRELANEPRLGVAELLAFVARYRSLISISVLVSLALGVCYLLVAPRVFVAQSQVLIQLKRSQMSNGLTPLGLLQLDSAQLESQIQLVKSERIARYVVRQLNLVDDPEFRPDRVRTRTPEQQLAAEGAVISRIDGRLSVRRIGQSYVIEVAFWSGNPDTAARVANAVTAAYIRDQVLERLDLSQKGGEILEGRIAALREDLATLEQAARTGVIRIDAFPTADGTVITSASPPSGKSWPKSSLVLALAGFIGLFLGLVVAVIRHASIDRVRSRRQVENDLQVPILGMLPAIADAKAGGVYSYLAENPQSAFANQLRGVKTEIDLAMLDMKVQCIGVASARAGEGKSVVASNLAQAFALAGRRTLLMDCDVGTHSVSTAMASSALSGLKLTERLEPVNIAANYAVLPITNRHLVANFSDFLISEEMRQALNRFRTDYDMVIVDLPALDSASDARAMSPLLDAIVVVAEFDTTPVDVLSEAVQILDRPASKVLGVIINKFKRYA